MTTEPIDDSTTIPTEGVGCPPLGPDDTWSACHEVCPDLETPGDEEAGYGYGV